MTGGKKEQAPLRIALVSEHASPLAALGGADAGGQNVHVARLAETLAARGHRVTVYTRRDSPDLPERLPLRHGVDVHHVPAGPPEPVTKDELLPHMGMFGAFLSAQWAAERPHLVHSHFWMSGLATLQAAQERALPFAHTYHALGTVKRRHQKEADTSPGERIPCETAVGTACDRIIATCRDEVEELAAMGVGADRVSVVPCGVDPDVFTPTGPLWPRPARRPLLVQVGRLVPRKGAAVSIAALARVPGAELLVAGGPGGPALDRDPEARRLRALARELGVADRVHLTGGLGREEVPRLMRAADAVLCPADYEPFGIVPLEAMSCGTPVVATEVGGQRDTVAHRGTGLLVPPQDPAALARAVRTLLAMPARGRAYGASGRRRVLSRYSWERVVSQTEEVYRDVLAARSAPAAEPATVTAAP
ncbi:glycosyltransferase family 1 protein [Streptomyces diacarni]|uniref:D-inositol 3-phosphate glycosyltransferase n=1 Tax=Streptomyces diacarni TaxID=2800381 RepID=A0A367F703_9ACTN|nr:glycosyltransferase [Streptomyces diacarni]RCG26031.1 glycosyltransferase family 1 protein [Streptomyces diacarni]